MQFVRNGPDIPERLLQMHEDGRVVFFCGAGISYPARLPGFSGLVTRLYQDLSVTPSPVQQAAIKAGQFDTAIGLLEADVVGGREPVRRAIVPILTPDLSAPGATTTHEALLTLSENRDGRTRLITTNFDRLFEQVLVSKGISPQTYQAPLLPVPKTRWDGVVYLHGLLTATPTAAELDRLVISSGDFGLAYLIERWAARFVSELFRAYTVCFVGYSINDPVLRYMMDALAADRLLGESPPEMFAFGSHSMTDEVERSNEWKAKNVTPILYQELEQHDHTSLHKTLHAWAETYRDGVRGKERIVMECAISRPLASTKQDDFVGRMLWALSDPGSLPAKRFAELNPVPSLDWLDPLCQDLYRHSDLGRFGIPTAGAVDEKLVFSLTSRPAPYGKAPWMAMTDRRGRASQWDEVMHHLARWLARHLDDPKLLLWLVKQGGQLHHQLIWLIERQLGELSKLERDNNADELMQLRRNAPNSIPRPAMRTLWRVLLNGRVKSPAHDLDLYRWREYFLRDGLTASVRLALRDALMPRVSLRESFRLGSATEGEGVLNRIKDIVEWEIELTSDHVHSSLSSFSETADWLATLPDLLHDFGALLRDALDLMHELGGVDNLTDHSYVHQPSISKHQQNKDFRDWTALIELTRDAWLATAEKFPDQARITAEAWLRVPYPIFRRLALFAAAQGNAIPRRMALDFLLKDDHWWLWSVETQREAVRLLVALAPRLEATEMAELENALLVGPPRRMFRDNIDVDAWARLVDRSIWLRLAKAEKAGATLGANAAARLAALSTQYPEWQLSANERDEFPFWMESEWVGGRDPWKLSTSLPRTRRGILNYLLAHPALSPSEQDDWRQCCSKSFQATAYSLCKLSQENNWPVERWRDALQAWSEEALLERSWNYLAPLVATAPDKLLQQLARGVSGWLQSASKSFQRHEPQFLVIANRILQFEFESEDDIDEPVFRAINHPVGHITQALLDWWYRKELEDRQGLPDTLKPIFSALCDRNIAKFKHGRVLLAAHIITLFRVDKEWSEQYLLPLFDWTQSESEARAAWEGYLWSPRLYRPLMELLKPAFLDTADHYSKLGKHSGQYASLLTFAALDPGDTFSVSELADAIRTLPSEGLREVAKTLAGALEGASDQREDYWKNRIQPFWETIWPKSNNRALDMNAASLARLCIAAGGEFPTAITTIGSWLRPADHPDYIVHKLYEAGLCARFPESALQLLNAVLASQLSWLPRELRQCLDAIAQGMPTLRDDRKFRRIDELARKFGS